LKLIFHNVFFTTKLINFIGDKVMSSILRHLVGFAQDENGASAAEYALILAIVTTGIAGATIFLGQTISGAISDAASCISGAENMTPC
jgi:pilus assembly protein Flp/PilA